jgi:hypothetical protein
VWLLIQQNNYVWQHLFSLYCHAPCTKGQSSYCDTCIRSFLSDKCYQNRLTVRVKIKLFSEYKQVCRNCSLLWLQIVSLNVSRHSAISVTISSHQSVFAMSVRSSLAKFRTDLCFFFPLLRNTRKIFNNFMDISKSTEQYKWSGIVFKVCNNWGLVYRLSTVANVSMCSVRNTYENLLSTWGSTERLQLRFILLHIIMVDTIHSFVQQVSVNELWYRISDCCLRVEFI